MKSIRIDHADNVAVVIAELRVGDQLGLTGVDVRAVEHIGRGHKVALADIRAGEKIIKYGVPIGHATVDIRAGSKVHTHNMKTDLEEAAEYSYKSSCDSPLAWYNANKTRAEGLATHFQGFVRSDGSVGVRNELWIIPTVGCVNSVAQKLAADCSHLVQGTIDGVHAFVHPYGCSQMGDDHEQTRRILADLVRHPNAGGVLVLGLGCENNTMEQFKQELGTDQPDWDDKRVRFLVSQEVEDEYAESRRLLEELAAHASTAVREQVSVDKLIVGLKCGGSDGLSGITANPAVGRFSDLLVAAGGASILTEVPEMFGAEEMLMNRCESKGVFDATVKMIEDFKEYFVAHGQTVYENPSPGNKDGGISTLEDKSCGCVQKGGTAPVQDVIDYGGRVRRSGLNLLSGPGNDLVSTTALTAAGAQIILFTTGRGTPFGAPAPTVKISSNSELFNKKGNWIDFNAGTVVEDESLDAAGLRLYEYVLDVANGSKTRNEINGFREIAIFKDGVTL